MERGDGFVKWFSELSIKDAEIAGIKGASLAEIYKNKFPVPPGFVITKKAFEYFIEKAKIKEIIEKLLQEVNIENDNSLESSSEKIIQLIMNSKFPDELREQILEAYDVLDVDKSKFTGAAESALDILRNSYEPPFVAVRSSVISNELELSFAGQHESFLNVKGNDELINSVKMAFASAFMPRAIYYKKKKTETGLVSAVVVQKMIDSQKSGIIFSKNPSDSNSIFIEAVFGLGSGITDGKIFGDQYVLDKKLEIGSIKVADKKIALTRNSSGKTEIVKLSDDIGRREVLTGHELKMLGQFALRLEEMYEFPQSIEFAIDREGIHILQSAPIIGAKKIIDSELEGNVLFSGIGASNGIGSGIVRIIKEKKDLGKIQRGNIIVLKDNGADYSVAIQKAAGIIVDGGSIGARGTLLAREAGIPAVINTNIATEKLKDGQIVTVDGFTGRIIEGTGVQRKMEIKKILPTKNIKIGLVVDIPDYAVRAAESGVRDVGLTRLENLIASKGKHPVWYIKNEKLGDYISMIYDGTRKIARHFNNIKIRLSNFKSDEFSNLEGFPDKKEINPLLGDCGIRFGLKNFDLLEAEIRGIKDLADEYEAKKFGIVLPKVFSVKEVAEVKKITDKIKMPENVEIGVMIETPASVQVIDELCEAGIKFVNIGIKDLTEYTLAVDRENEEVRDLYDEKNPAVLKSISYVLRECKKYAVRTGIVLSEIDKKMIEFLAKEGVDGVSVTADCAYEASKIINEIESKIMVEDKAKENGEYLSYEEKILKEFDSDSEMNQAGDDYSPGIEKEDDIPKLNEAIPVSSEDLSGNVDNIGVIELSPEEIGGNIYEKQQETALDVEAKIEKETSMSNEEALARLFGQEEGPKEKKKEQDEVSGIF